MNGKNTLKKAAGQTSWPSRGAQAYACGSAAGVLDICSIDYAGPSGVRFFSGRRYAAGETVGLQLNLGLGRGEFRSVLVNARVKACRAFGRGQRSLCRVEAGWAGGEAMNTAFATA